MAWIAPGKEIVDGGGGQLFANLRAAFSPVEIRAGLDNLRPTVAGATPDTVFEHTLMPSAGELNAAEALYLLGEQGFNGLHDAVYKWHTDAEAGGFGDAAMTAAETRRRQAEAAIAAAIDAGRDPTDDEVSENHASADDFAKKLRERTAADEKLTADLARIAVGLIGSAGGLGETLKVSEIGDSGREKPGTRPGDSPSAPGATAPAPGAPSAPGSPGTPGPRNAPSGVPGGEIPGTTPKNPEVQQRIADLMKAQQQNQPQQQQQQPVAAGAPTAASPGTQSKPAEKAKPAADEAIQKMLADVDARSGDTGMPPLAAAAVVPDASPAQTPVAPPAPKPNVGGGSFSNGTTTANTTGGQTPAAKVSLSSAVPTQETVNPAQRTGAQPMGQGMPMSPMMGGPGQQGTGGKEQPRIAQYRRMTDQERDIHGRIATEDEAVRGGTLIRGDHVDQDDAKNSGPRKR